MKPVVFLHWPPWAGVPEPLPKPALDALAEILNREPRGVMTELHTGRDGECLCFQQWPTCFDLWVYEEPHTDLSQEGTQGICWSGSCMTECGCRVVQEAARLIIQRHQARALFPEAI